MAVQNIGVITSSGLNVQAPIHVWLVAIMQSLTPQQQQAVYNKVLSMTDDKKILGANGPAPTNLRI